MEPMTKLSPQELVTLGSLSEPLAHRETGQGAVSLEAGETTAMGEKPPIRSCGHRVRKETTTHIAAISPLSLSGSLLHHCYWWKPEAEEEKEET